MKAFLEELKRRETFFEYRIWYDDISGTPQGVTWVIKKMRERFVCFGATLSLDAMKGRLKSLGWKYIAPAILDHELRVGVCAKSILIEESHESYAFVMNSLF